MSLKLSLALFVDLYQAFARQSSLKIRSKILGRKHQAIDRRVCNH